MSTTKKRKISVLGCGRWGSFLAWYCNEIGHDVFCYGMDGEPSYESLKNLGRNEYVEFPKSITVTNDLQKAVSRAEIIIISVPSQAFRGFIKRIVDCGIDNKLLCLNMKGIEIETGMRLTEVAIEEGVAPEQVAVWVGPGHIQEFVNHKPNCMIIDGYDRATVDALISAFKSPLIRFYYGNDIIGTEIGAAAKNVMGIVAGVLDGMQLTTLKGALMARGAREVARLIKALGGNEFSAYGLCHLGDYETTLFSEFSHNRKWGEEFVKGKPFQKLAEGVYTARALTVLSENIGVDMPLTRGVFDMIYEHVSPNDILERLFNRNLKREF